MRTLALFAVLIGLVPLTAEAEPADLCNTVATTISSLKPAEDPRGPWSSPVRTLQNHSRGVVSVDLEGWRVEKAEATLERLRNEYRLPPNLLEKVGPSDWYGRTIHRFGKSSLHLGQLVGGTAYCKQYAFFNAPGTTVAQEIDPPPGLPRGDGAICWSTSGYAAEVTGVPAFILQSDRDNAVELSVTPWRDGTWGMACHLTITFSNDFEASGKFCQDVNCEAMADRAVWLAKQLDESPRGGFGILDMRKLAADARLGVDFPTFGGQLQDSYHSTYHEFSSDAIFVPIVVDGTMYIGRIGHAAFAWRTSYNYVFAAYRMTGKALEAVAGIYIKKTRFRPEKVKVD